MEYPSISEYKEAVQYADSFESAVLRELKPVKVGNEPVMTSGNFAVVFKMQNQKTGEFFALKCFTQDQADRAEAYNKIIEELRYIRSPYFINLEYINEGIWAGDYDNAFPVLLMPWVEGESLDIHIAKLADKDPERLQLVSYEFSVMASWLVNQPFAHGDIKPDNIMVRPDGSLVLVDYDGLYVPSMYGSSSREAGTPSFRHPNRPTMVFDEKIDDFPLASINLSLYLISLKPSLLKSYGAKDRLLFLEKDYLNLSDCKLLDEVSGLFSDAQLQRLYALFLIALSEGCLQKCENTLMLLRPPHKDFKIKKLQGTKANVGFSKEPSQSSQDLEFNVNGVKFKMKFVEGGNLEIKTAVAGAFDFETGLQDFEDFTKVVKLDSYYMSETLVTQELWQVVMGSNPSSFKGEKNPVENVGWNEIQEFVKKLNSVTAKNFTLPTEVQWEYAARGGCRSKGYIYSGSNNVDDVSWYEENSKGHTHPVATKQPNELGIYDMSGNLWEICRFPYSMNRLGCTEFAGCGGCWSGEKEACHISARLCVWEPEDIKSEGFRLVLSKIPQDLVFNVNGVQFTMKYVEGGTFMMGATDDDSEAWNDEKPAHKVRLDSYYVGETLVTQELWQAVMGNNPSNFKGNQFPVEQVSWNDCQEFINKLNNLTGKTFSLPTEAQWEFAARGGNKNKGYKYSGSDNLDEVSWYVGNSNDRTHIVAIKNANELGLYDMTGNVFEWCNDWFDRHYYSNLPQDNPKGPSSGDNRVLRGGGWYDRDRGCRVSNRGFDSPDGRFNNHGFRLVLQV